MYLLADQSSNAKLRKNLDINDQWQTSILHLSPSDSSGLMNPDGTKANLCPGASPGCRAACLNTAGRGAMNSVQLGRLRKTALYVSNRSEFIRQLVRDLETLVSRQNRTGIRQAIRLNGTSDIAWESQAVDRDDRTFPGIPQAFPELQFYDYTKLPARARTVASFVKNYHLTFSRSEVNQVQVNRLLRDTAVNVALVFSGDRLPAEWQGRTVIDGTLHDMRFLDPAGCIVGLLAKGRARKDMSGFVVELEQSLAKGA